MRNLCASACILYHPVICDSAIVAFFEKEILMRERERIAVDLRRAPTFSRPSHVSGPSTGLIVNASSLLVHAPVRQIADPSVAMKEEGVRLLLLTDRDYANYNGPFSAGHTTHLLFRENTEREIVNYSTKLIHISFSKCYGLYKCANLRLSCGIRSISSFIDRSSCAYVHDITTITDKTRYYNFVTLGARTQIRACLRDTFRIKVNLNKKEHLYIIYLLNNLRLTITPRGRYVITQRIEKDKKGK